MWLAFFLLCINSRFFSFLVSWPGKISHRTLSDGGTKAVWLTRERMVVIVYNCAVLASEHRHARRNEHLRQRNPLAAHFSTNNSVASRTDSKRCTATYRPCYIGLKMIYLYRKLVDNYSCWAITCDWNPKLGIHVDARSHWNGINVCDASHMTD